jgi:hypothetical protein
MCFIIILINLSLADRYINEPGKGPSDHTDEFMSGYHDGYSACLDEGEQNGESSDKSADPESDPICNLHPGLLAGCKLADELTR